MLNVAINKMIERHELETRASFLVELWHELEVRASGEARAIRYGFG